MNSEKVVGSFGMVTLHAFSRIYLSIFERFLSTAHFVSRPQVSLKYAFESKNDLFLILDLMTGGEFSKTINGVTHDGADYKG